MLIELHIIRDHGPSNMNRDDYGRPKTAIYGGTPRLRVSSQCWKRALRQPRPADRPDAQPGIFERTVGQSHFGVRTRLLPEKVAEKWSELHGDNAPFLQGIKAAVSSIAKKEAKEQETKADGRVRTPQAIYLELDREVERIVAVLERLRAEDKLQLLADESQVFADHLENAATAIGWERKGPSKAISWESVKATKNWQSLVAAYEALDLPDRPVDFDPTADPKTLVPSYELARGILELLIAFEAEDATQSATLLKNLAPPKGGPKPKSGARISLADELKLTAGNPVCAADIALFGRMTTSDAFQDVEAACQVADAISTHPIDEETDYFTAVDDLDPGTGAAHVGQSKFASAVFYHNIVVDYDALLRNLGAEIPKDREDDEALKRIAVEAPEIAARAIEGLLRAIMSNVPTGKINSHAHNQQPSLLLVEVKPTKIATSYLTAFHEPARAGEREDGTTETLLSDSVRKLLAFARYRDRKMGIPRTQRFVFAFDEATEDAIARLRESLKQGESCPLSDDEFFKNSTLTICDEFNEFVNSVVSVLPKGSRA